MYARGQPFSLAYIVFLWQLASLESQSPLVWNGLLQNSSYLLNWDLEWGFFFSFEWNKQNGVTTTKRSIAVKQYTTKTENLQLLNRNFIICKQKKHFAQCKNILLNNKCCKSVNEYKLIKNLLVMWYYYMKKASKVNAILNTAFFFSFFFFR